MQKTMLDCDYSWELMQLSATDAYAPPLERRIHCALTLMVDKRYKREIECAIREFFSENSPAEKIMRSKYSGFCHQCYQFYRKGQLIIWQVSNRKVYCSRCTARRLISLMDAGEIAIEDSAITKINKKDAEIWDNISR